MVLLVKMQLGRLPDKLVFWMAKVSKLCKP